MNKKIICVIAILLVAGPSSVLANEGKELFNKLCVSCHKLHGPPETAPPVFAVVNHVKSVYPEREDFIKRVTEWVKQPDINDALMPGAARRFGVMPKLPYMESDVKKVAEYLYDTEIVLPEWYMQHYKQKHGVEPTK